MNKKAMAAPERQDCARPRKGTWPWPRFAASTRISAGWVRAALHPPRRVIQRQRRELNGRIDAGRARDRPHQGIALDRPAAYRLLGGKGVEARCGVFRKSQRDPFAA